MLPILFGGGVIRNKKLQKGSVIQISKEEEFNQNVSINLSSFELFDSIYLRKACSIENLLSIAPYPLKKVFNEEKKPSPPTQNLKLKTPLLNLSLKPF